MRTVNVEEISKNIKEMCIEANHFLSKDMDIAMKNAVSTEKSPLGKKILSQLQDNLKIAGEDMIPICQDTGMAILFVEYGDKVVIEDGSFEDAVNEGVRQAYKDGYLRKSVVNDPVFDRLNTKDNTPAIIHTRIVKGDKIKITAGGKGFGSENMSAIKMLTPSYGIEGVKKFILDTVRTAGPNPCLLYTSPSPRD